MGKKNLKLKLVLLILFVISAVSAQADVVTCPAQNTLGTQAVKTPNTQPPLSPLDSKNKQTKNQQKSKSGSSYFGMFKLLIPDTLK